MQLQEICELIVDCEHKTAPTQETGFPSIRTPNIGPGYFILDGVKRVSEETYRLWTRRAVPRAGDLIMAREAPVGNVAIIRNGLHPCLGQRTLLIRPNPHAVSPDFLNYFLNGPDVQGRIRSKTNGATVAHLNMEDVRTLDLPTLPPIESQKAIARTLAAYDELIANGDRRIHILEAMARALYREWFVEFRYPHNAVAHEQWPVRRLGDAFETVLGGTPSRTRPEYWADGTVPWINSGAVNNLRITVPSELITERALRESAAKLMPVGTTVLAITGATLGQVSLLEIETAANQSVVGIIDRSAIFREWLYLTISDRIKQIVGHASGGAQQHINKEVVRSVKLTLPPPEVIGAFKQLVEPMFRQIATLLFQVKNLRATRDLLLPRLLSGQLALAETEAAVP